MNRLLISTAIAGVLALAAPALAQDRGDDHRDDRGKPAAAAKAAPPAPAARAPAPAQAAKPPLGAGNGRGFAPRQNAQNAAPPPAAQPTARGPDNRGSANRAPAPSTAMRGPGPSNSMRGPSNATRGSAQARDFSSYHRNFNAPQHYRITAYRRPSGWYSHRWTYGEILPSLFWAQDYWLNDFVDYGLAPPPPGTVWVRDGDDALLIDRYSGEIIQVEYSVFY